MVAVDERGAYRDPAFRSTGTRLLQSRIYELIHLTISIL
jgi:hypothetical protein